MNTRPETRTQQAMDEAVRSLFEVGRLWAAHGLHVGRSALDTGAATLRTTAEVLAQIAQRLEKPND